MKHVESELKMPGVLLGINLTEFCIFLFMKERNAIFSVQSLMANRVTGRADSCLRDDIILDVLHLNLASQQARFMCGKPRLLQPLTH